ncbi:MAG: ABC transporter ATP-binding protein [Desulfobacterales bacterium]|nr:MAG: ABC transporter ATP-binding protein [Desulfobacterales bacterium]
MFLSITDLFVNYGKLEVLKGVSMEIEEGEISLLLGANGSGKSTLLKTITGLNRPISGSIRFQETKINGMASYDILRLGIAHILEGRKIFPLMTVLENLELGAYSRKNKREIARDIEAMCERFPILGQKRKEQSGNLSGGEQQTLVIALALMTKAKLLLMDEPSQGLSPLLVNEIANTITGLNRDGLSIVLVEHNLRLGLSIADKVYVLENGKIAFEANSTDLSGVEYAQKIYLGG